MFKIIFLISSLGFTMLAQASQDSSSITNLNSFGAFIKNNNLNLAQVGTLMDSLDPNVLIVICNDYKGAKNWEEAYKQKGLSQAIASVIKAKCDNKLQDTLKQQGNLGQGAKQSTSTTALPTLKPVLVAPTPSPAPQKTLSQMMEEELSDDWGFYDEPSANKPPSRSATPEAQTVELAKPAPLQLPNMDPSLRDEFNALNAKSYEEKIFTLYTLIPSLRGYIKSKVDILSEYQKYLKTPQFEKQYGANIKELGAVIDKFNEDITKLNELDQPGETFENSNSKSLLGVAVGHLNVFKEKIKSDLLLFPEGSYQHINSKKIIYDRPGRAEQYYEDDFGLSSMPNALAALNRMKKTYDDIEKTYKNILDDFTKEYNKISQNYSNKP